MHYLKETDSLLSYVSTKMHTAAMFQLVADFLGMITACLINEPHTEDLSVIFTIQHCACHCQISVNTVIPCLLISDPDTQQGDQI